MSQHPQRLCGSCLAQDRSVPAVYVAQDADGLSWFECAGHGPTDNLCETVRIRRELIQFWYQRHGWFKTGETARAAGTVACDSLEALLRCQPHLGSASTLCRRCHSVQRSFCPGPFSPLEVGRIAVAVSELPLTA